MVMVDALNPHVPEHRHQDSGPSQGRGSSVVGRPTRPTWTCLAALRPVVCTSDDPFAFASPVRLRLRLPLPVSRLLCSRLVLFRHVKEDHILRPVVLWHVRVDILTPTLPILNHALSLPVALEPPPHTHPPPDRPTGRLCGARRNHHARRAAPRCAAPTPTTSFTRLFLPSATHRDRHAYTYPHPPRAADKASAASVSPRTRHTAARSQQPWLRWRIRRGRAAALPLAPLPAAVVAGRM